MKSKHDVFSRKRIIAVTHVKVMKQYDYGYLEEIKVQMEDQTLYKFKEALQNYNMHNIRNTIGELHALLIEYDKGLPKKASIPQVLVIQEGRIQISNKKSQNSKGKGKGKPKGKDKLKKKQADTASTSGEWKLKQGVVYLYVGNGVCAQVEAIEEHPSDTQVFTVKMEILLDPTSNKLMVFLMVAPSRRGRRRSVKVKELQERYIIQAFKLQNQEKYEHVGPYVTRSQDGKITRWRKEIMLG
ncbi:hypothetical protein Tco_0526176 [Tanacetum coccineum]